jgi:hypothetical protein
MGAMRPNQHHFTKELIKLRSIEFSQYLGATLFKDYIHASTIDFNFGIGSNYTAQLKLPYMYISGPLGTNSGIGDISYSITRQLWAKNNNRFQLTIGGKIPTNASNAQSADSRPLPMYYQTSLGTYDLVFGASFVSRKWLYAIGYQTALNSNANEFRWSEWAGAYQNEIARSYPPAWNLKRGTDLMARVERNFRSLRWNGYFGILAIYRFSHDNISRGKENIRADIDNTTGFAITALSGLGYRLNSSVGIKALFGQKIINRKTNPDGLSREWVASLGVEIRL